MSSLPDHLQAEKKGSKRFTRRLSFWKTSSSGASGAGDGFVIERKDNPDDWATKARSSTLDDAAAADLGSGLRFEDDPADIRRQSRSMSVNDAKVRPSGGSSSLRRPSAKTLTPVALRRNPSMSQVRSIATQQLAGGENTDHLMLSPRGRAGEGSQSWRRQSTSSPPGTPTSEAAPPAPRIGALFQVRVLYDFVAQDANEVSVQEGEVCDVAFDVMREHGWFEVVRANDERGLIPVSFCEVIAESVPDAAPHDDVDFDESKFDESDAAFDASLVSDFKEGRRDSATIVAPSMYSASAEYVFADDGPPSDLPPSGANGGYGAAIPAAPASGSPGAANGGGGESEAYASDEEISPRTEKRRQRAHVVREVYETERTYVADLRFVCTNFLKPVRKNSVLKSNDIDIIFRNIETIYELHREMLTNLEECVAAGLASGGRFPAANASIASVFISLSAYLKLYTV